MKDEGKSGTLVYTGMAREIVALLREHAERANGNADYFGAADMRRGADDLETGLRSAYKFRAAYVVDGDASDPDVSATELAETSGTP